MRQAAGNLGHSEKRLHRAFHPVVLCEWFDYDFCGCHFNSTTGAKSGLEPQAARKKSIRIRTTCTYLFSQNSYFIKTSLY